MRKRNQPRELAKFQREKTKKRHAKRRNLEASKWYLSALRLFFFCFFFVSYFHMTSCRIFIFSHGVISSFINSFIYFLHVVFSSFRTFFLFVLFIFFVFSHGVCSRAVVSPRKKKQKKKKKHKKWENQPP